MAVKLYLLSFFNLVHSTSLVSTLLNYFLVFLMFNLGDNQPVIKNYDIDGLLGTITTNELIDNNFNIHCHDNNIYYPQTFILDKTFNRKIGDELYKTKSLFNFNFGSVLTSYGQVQLFVCLNKHYKLISTDRSSTLKQLFIESLELVYTTRCYEEIRPIAKFDIKRGVVNAVIKSRDLADALSMLSGRLSASEQLFIYYELYNTKHHTTHSNYNAATLVIKNGGFNTFNFKDSYIDVCGILTTNNTGNDLVFINDITNSLKISGIKKYHMLNITNYMHFHGSYKDSRNSPLKCNTMTKINFYNPLLKNMLHRGYGVLINRKPLLHNIVNVLYNINVSNK